MAGEINFGILNQNLPAEIAGSYYRGQEQQQQNALAKQQLSQAQMSTQVSGMQLEKMKRDAAALDQMQKAIVGSGGPPDLKTAFQAMINSGMPDHVNSGIAGLQKLQEHEQFRNIMGGRAAAPAAGGGGMSEPYEGYNAEIGAPAGAATNEPYPGYNAAIGAPTGNALAPAPTTNALAPQPANAKTAKIAELRGKIDDFIALGTPRALAAAKVMEADLRQLMTPPVYHNVPGVGLVDPSTGRVVTSEVTKPQNLNETQQLIKDLKTETDPAARKVLQNRLDFLGRHPPVAKAAPEPAPTITQVVDPKNSKQMLNVNARLYGGGTLGDAGVIGVAGREPGYVAREEKAATKQTETDKSKGQVDNLVAQLGSYYDALSDEGGITSTGLRAGSNVMAGLASSGLGQATGRLFGTQAQSQRNSIVQTRPLLVQAIKNATGMSAKQMDSNVELKMMLATATDPTLDIESNRRALANLAALYGTGSGAAPPPTPSPGAPTRANAAKARAAPAGVAAELWNVMTPEEQKLWQK
jgi:hypothetical protein